jgi:hypothetical protein
VCFNVGSSGCGFGTNVPKTSVRCVRAFRRVLY